MFLCLRAIRRECFATELDKCAMQCLQFEAHVLLTVANQSQLANTVSSPGRITNRCSEACFHPRLKEYLISVKQKISKSVAKTQRCGGDQPVTVRNTDRASGPNARRPGRSPRPPLSTLALSKWRVGGAR